LGDLVVGGVGAGDGVGEEGGEGEVDEPGDGDKDVEDVSAFTIR